MARRAEITIRVSEKALRIRIATIGIDFRFASSAGECVGWESRRRETGGNLGERAEKN